MQRAEIRHWLVWGWGPCTHMESGLKTPGLAGESEGEGPDFRFDSDEVGLCERAMGRLHPAACSGENH